MRLVVVIAFFVHWLEIGSDLDNDDCRVFLLNLLSVAKWSGHLKFHSFLRVLLGFAVAAAFATGANADDVAPAKPIRKTVELTDQAKRIHSAALVCDGHNDFPWEMRDKANYSFAGRDMRQPLKGFHTDIPRLREGGVGWQFWSAYVPTTATKTHTAAKDTFEQIDFIHAMVEQYPETFEMAATSDDVVRIRKAGKIACMIGVEGGHSMENSLGLLRNFYRLGVRYMTLTHSENIDWADSATDKPKHNGLTPFGKQVVVEMNRIGMLVDISHVSPKTMHDALDVTKAPVIASHSSAYTIANHPRNVPDDVLKRLPTNGGVIMINFFSGFITPEAALRTKKMFEVGREFEAKYPRKEDFKAAFNQWKKENPFPRGSIHDVIDHIDHIVKIAGVDHVGLGSDYDGITSCPVQLDDVASYPYITQELLNRGYREEAIQKILGGNILRALRQAEAAKSSVRSK